MKTKEAIEFVEEIKKYFDNVCNHKANETIKLLKRGEKFEQMWGEFDELYGHFDIIPLGTSYHIYELMERLKQKYFPKEVDTNEIKMGERKN